MAGLKQITEHLPNDVDRAVLLTVPNPHNSCMSAVDGYAADDPRAARVRIGGRYVLSPVLCASAAP